MRNVSTLSKMAVGASLLVTVVTFNPFSSAASSPPQFGSLGNFDVFNDTGAETHGFEIELDGITSANVTYEFGAPYERYGNPQVVDFSGGVKIIYASPYDTVAKQFTEATPVPPQPITATGGHACWTGGSANYATAGCEHFGLGLNATPTNIVYDWLVADPVHPGNLMPFGGGVQLPAPVWSVAAAPPNAPNPAPVVQAVVAAPEPDLGQQLGNAEWVKVFVSESAKAQSLGRLLTGDSAVPNKPTEVETEWVLIQAGAGGGLATELVDQGQLAKSSESITRRYEFYKYTGAYDPSGHEALPINDTVPAKGDLGQLIGTQMAALNLAPGGAVPGDHTAPKAFIDTKLASSTKLKTARIVFHATDPDNKTFTYFCSLDHAIPTVCTSPRSLANLKVGRHIVTVYAADAVRNASKPVSVTWSVLK